MKDPLAVGLGSLACGAGFGGGTIVAALVIVRTLEHHVSVASYEESAADPVLIGAFAGMAVAAGFGWWRSRALNNVWQRGVIAVMAAVGAILVAFIAWPVDQLLGIAGLAAWGVVSFVLGGAGSVWARKGSREDAIDIEGRGKGEKGGRGRGTSVTERAIEVIEAGLVPYDVALAWQRDLARARIDGRLDHDVLLLLEHPPVVTVGRSARGTSLPDAGGIDVVEVERGGDVTYHGPGQLVGYPILDLTQHRADVHWYLRTLEQTLIAALADLAIPAQRRPGYTGVWTRGGGRKIASIGVHVKRWVTWHGFALNVTTDLSPFERIVPCGIAGVEMTSVEREEGRGKREESVWDETVGAVIRGFEGAFGVTTSCIGRPLTVP